MIFTKEGQRHVVSKSGGLYTETRLEVLSEAYGIPLDVLDQRLLNGDTFEELIRPLPLAHCEPPSKDWITTEDAASLIGCGLYGLRNAMRESPIGQALVRRRSRGKGKPNRVGYLWYRPDVEDVAAVFRALGCQSGNGRWSNGVAIALRVLEAARAGKFVGLEREEVAA